MISKNMYEARNLQDRERRRLSFRKWALWIVFLFFLLVGISLLALLVGAQPVNISEVFTAGSLDHTVVFGIRLPRVVLGLIVGGALGGSGAVLQAILRNPLADPFVLGVSGGAALGATAVIVIGTIIGSTAAGSYAISEVETQAVLNPAASILSSLPVSAAAALGALLSTLLILVIARGGGKLDPVSMLLAGVVFNALAAALILFMRTLVTPDQAHALLPWLVGNLGHKPWPQLVLSGLFILFGSCFLLFRAVHLNIMSVGEDSAASLGIDIDRTRLELIILISLMVGASVSLAGLVGFVGLIVPHLLRLLLGPDYRLLLPASILGGSIFLVGCDILSRLAFLRVGTELPVGVVTALIGAPVFLSLLRRNAGRRIE